MTHAKKVLFLFLLCLVSFSAHAQRQYYYGFGKAKRYWSAGVSINGTEYMGDVAPRHRLASMDFRQLGGSFSAYGQYRFESNFSYRIAYAANWIYGEDANAKDVGRLHRNLHFRNRVHQLTFEGIYHIIGNNSVYYRRPKFPIPFVKLGAGVLYHNPQARSAEAVDKGLDSWTDLRPLKTHGKSRMYLPVAVVIPVGIGATVKLGPRMDLGVEATIHYTSTDYLDDIGTEYYMFSEYNQKAAQQGFVFRGLEKKWPDGKPRAEAGGAVDYTRVWDYITTNGVMDPTKLMASKERRGASGNKDVYASVGFHLTYIINATIKTPKFR